MPYQDPIHPPENYIPRQMYTLYSVFCLLLSAFLFSIATPFLRFAQGQALSASEGRLRTTLELTTDPPQAGWAATYGGFNYDWAASIQQTKDGGYIAAGYFTSYFVSSFGSEVGGLWVLKLRPDGTVEWQKAYGGVGAESIQQTSDGGYIVAGAMQSFGDEGEEIHHLWVLKLRPDGTMEWQNNYGGVDYDRSNSIRQTTDGGYIVAGYTKSFGAGKSDLWVLKLRPDGTIEWQRTYGGADGDEAESIQQTTDGGYVVTGYTKSFGAGGGDLWVLKLRPDGTVEWQKSYGREREEWAMCIQQTRDGGYIATGGTRSFGAGGADLWVLKLRPDGAVDWQKTYGGGSSDWAKSIQETGDSGFIVAGVTESFGAGKSDLWVLELRPDGAVDWQKAYGGIYEDGAESIQQTADDGYIVAGRTGSFYEGVRGILDFWVLKLKPDGSIRPSCNFIIRDTKTSGINSNAIPLDTSASVKDSSANPQVPWVKVRATNASADILCP